MAGQKTCKERIADHLESRKAQFMPGFDDLSVDDLKKYIEDYGGTVPDPGDCGGDENDEAYRETLREVALEVRDESVSSVLSVDKRTVYRVCLSWGGPADYFEFDFQSGDCVGGRYQFQDWGDGAEIELTMDEAEEWSQIFGIYEE